MNEARLLLVNEACAPGRITAIEARPTAPFDGENIIVDAEVAEHFTIVALLIDGDSQSAIGMIEGIPASRLVEGSTHTSRDLDRCSQAAILLVRNNDSRSHPFRGKITGYEAPGEPVVVTPDGADPRPAHRDCCPECGKPTADGDATLVAHVTQHSERLLQLLLKGHEQHAAVLMQSSDWLTRTNVWLVRRYEKTSALAMALVDFAHELVEGNEPGRARLKATVTKYLDEATDAADVLRARVAGSDGTQPPK